MDLKGIMLSGENNLKRSYIIILFIYHSENDKIIAIRDQIPGLGGVVLVCAYKGIAYGSSLGALYRNCGDDYMNLYM